MTRFIAIIVLASLLSACSKFYPAAPHHDQDNSGVPDRFSMYSEKEATFKSWWKGYNSPQLNRLITEAIGGNFSIQEALARLKQAGYSAAKSESSLSPTLDYSAGGSYQTQKSKGKSRSADDSWSFGLSASYEVDLWGRLRADKNSTYYNSQATQEDVKTALMTVTGEITKRWLNLISLSQQQDLIQHTLELQKQLLELMKIRFPAGQTTALGIYQQQQVIERISASLIPISSEQDAIKRQIAFLVGKSSIETDFQIQQFFPVISKTPVIGLPADLIAARPDIRAAGLRLKSSQWEITAAKADRLPALKLTASHTHLSSNFADILDNWLVNLAANITGPIFDGKRRELEVERTKAVVEERLETYRKTVFTAIKEVEDALADESRQIKSVSSLMKQLSLSKKTIREAKNRYSSGSTDFLNVLLEELSNMQIQQDLITSKEKMILARINLYIALGGAWLDEGNM